MTSKNETQYLKNLIEIGFIKKYKDLDNIEKWLNQVGIFIALIKPDYLHICSPEVLSFADKKLTICLEFTKETKEQLNLKENRVWIRQKDGMPQNDDELFKFMENSNFSFDRENAERLLNSFRIKNEQSYLDNKLEEKSIQKLKTQKMKL
jgi:hypothetical protein